MTKFASQGLILEYGTAVGASAVAATAPGADTFTAVGQVETVGGPGIEKAQIDVTSLDDAAKTFIADLSEGGTVDFSVFLDGSFANHQVLHADAAAQDRIRNWRVTINDDATLANRTLLDFTAEILSWQPSFEVGSAVKVDVSAKVSGAITPTWHA